MSGCLVCSSVSNIGVTKEQSISLSREGINFKMQVSGHGSSETRLSLLRNKVREHTWNKPLTEALKVVEQWKYATTEGAVERMTLSHRKETEAVYCPPLNRPFSHHESFIKWCKVGLSSTFMAEYTIYTVYGQVQVLMLQVQKTYWDELQSKSVSNIIASSNKLAVLIDGASFLRFSQSINSRWKPWIHRPWTRCTRKFKSRWDIQGSLTCLSNAGFPPEWQKGWPRHIWSFSKALYEPNT